MHNQSSLVCQIVNLSGDDFQAFLEDEGIPFDLAEKIQLDNNLDYKLFIQLTDEDIASICCRVGDRLRIKNLQKKLRVSLSFYTVCAVCICD